MLKTSKKILSVLMVIVMVLAAVPLSGFVGIELPAFDLGIRASALAESGQCGDNVYWSYNSATGELVISGVGAMYDYDYYGSPFSGSDIKSVVICEGVTKIGKQIFSYCQKLTNVEISDSVTTIGDNAFYYTGYYNNSSNWENDVLYIGKYLIKAKTSLSGSYTIEDGSKIIADYAFSFCNSLTNVTIPNSITTIGSYAFSGCSLLETIEIPDSVTYIGSDILNNTAWYNYQNAGLIVLDD